MKYFTSEWWGTGCEDESVFEKYQEYYSSILSQLPQQLRTLDSKYTLHDSNVKSIHNDFIKNEVTIKLRGWDQAFNTPMAYEIKFIDVKEFKQVLPQDDEVESELGDLGYWEYEILNKNIEMRILFASSAQFNIVFKDFEFKNEPINE